MPQCSGALNAKLEQFLFLVLPKEYMKARIEGADAQFRAIFTYCIFRTTDKVSIFKIRLLCGFFVAGSSLVLPEILFYYFYVL